MMTKYTDSHNALEVRQDIPIAFSSEKYELDMENKTYYCKWCNCNLILQDEGTREYMCAHCNATEFPELDQSDVRSSHDLEVPDTANPTEKDLAISYSPEPSLDKPPIELPGTFKALQNKGLRITNFREEIPQ
jgi:hypothetical protein